MELNNNRTNLARDRYPEVQRASEARSAEIKATVDRVQGKVAEQREATSRIGQPADSIELSGAVTDIIQNSEATRAERLEELKAAAQDGSLFDRDRLALAAERLLASE